LKRAILGAVLGENRLIRTFDSLGFSAWRWTPVIGPDVVNVREVIVTFGNNVVALCELFNGNEAIYHSPDSGDSWTKVLEVTDIYDITSVGYNWTLASTSAGWYSSLTSGYSWTLVAAAGEGVPVGKSVVWTAPNRLFAHDGSSIWLSDDRGATWNVVCDLTAIAGYHATKFNSIDGYRRRVIATCGYALVETQDGGATWTAIELSTKFRGWSFISPEEPVWRQVVFWDSLDVSDPDKSRWMISAVLSKSNIIRTFVGQGIGTFSPVVDMALADRHRLNVSSTKRAGSGIADTTLTITGDRRIGGELRHAFTVSSDGITFTDVLAGETGDQPSQGNSTVDRAFATLQNLRA